MLIEFIILKEKYVFLINRSCSTLDKRLINSSEKKINHAGI